MRRAPGRMREILPNIFHWTATHPAIGIEVSSYYIASEGILIDPLMPPEGIEWFEQVKRPLYVLLTNRLHERDSGWFREAFRCIIHVHESGLSEGIAGGEVVGFAFGQRLPGNIEALEVNSICPDETALFIPKEGGIIAFADALIRYGEGPPAFVDDELMADTPDEVASVKAGLKAAFTRIVDSHDFDHLFFAHGAPMIGGGKDALRRFAKG